MKYLLKKIRNLHYYALASNPAFWQMVKIYINLFEQVIQLWHWTQQQSFEKEADQIHKEKYALERGLKRFAFESDEDWRFRRDHALEYYDSIGRTATIHKFFQALNIPHRLIEYKHRDQYPDLAITMESIDVRIIYEGDVHPKARIYAEQLIGELQRSSDRMFASFLRIYFLQLGNSTRVERTFTYDREIQKIINTDLFPNLLPQTSLEETNMVRIADGTWFAGEHQESQLLTYRKWDGVVLGNDLI